MVIKSIQIHQEEVNQTIKLRKENLYASCSSDNSFKIWQFDSSDYKSNVIVNNSCYHDFKIIAICELQDLNIVSISSKGFLIFWEYIDNVYEKGSILKGFKNCLLNCIFLFKNIILVGTKKSVIFIDIIEKIKIKKIDLKYNAYSIHYFDKKLFLGLKNNFDSCLLIEYELNNNYNDEINMGKGYDKCFEISSIYELNENKIVTCNKNNFIKIWKESESKPKNLFFDNNPNFYIEDDYESDNELELNNYNINESKKNLEKKKLQLVIILQLMKITFLMKKVKNHMKKIRFRKMKYLEIK